MTGTRLAVIDLGSNTFHFLICEVNQDRTWTVIHKQRSYVKLAQAGLEWIQQESIERAKETLIDFANQIRAYQVKKASAIGTSVLREAKNGSAVARELSAACGIEIDIIDGQLEASYILGGIRACIPPQKIPCLIMDIGGGSVEFILYQGNNILFKGSYKLGVAHLFTTYHQTDPITTSSVLEIEELLDRELPDLKVAVSSAGDFCLQGASGSFEVIKDVLPRIQESEHWSELDITNIVPYLDEIIKTDFHSRRQIPEIPIERLDYIVVAYILIRYIITRLRPVKLFYSEYALKEGVIEDMVEKLKI